jgi:hypothetical protein
MKQKEAKKNPQEGQRLMTRKHHRKKQMEAEGLKTGGSEESVIPVRAELGTECGRFQK